MEPELVVLRVEGEQTLNEDSDMWSGEMLAVARVVMVGRESLKNG